MRLFTEFFKPIPPSLIFSRNKGIVFQAKNATLGFFGTMRLTDELLKIQQFVNCCRKRIRNNWFSEISVKIIFPSPQSDLFDSFLIPWN